MDSAPTEGRFSMIFASPILKEFFNEWKQLFILSQTNCHISNAQYLQQFHAVFFYFQIGVVNAHRLAN